MTRPRRPRPAVLVGLVAFAASSGVAWAITAAVRDDAPAAAPAAEVAEAPPLADELPADADRASLPGGSAGGTDDLTLLAPTRVALDGRVVGTGVTPALAAELRRLPLAPTPPLDTTDDGGPTSTPTSSAPTSSAPPTSTSPAPATSVPDGAATFATRFVDPCAARPSVCAGLAGRPAVGGTIELADGEPAPMEIQVLSVSSGTSEGCATSPVLDGRRAIGVVTNRPATLTVSWARAGVAVGTTETFELTDADRDRFDARRGTWRGCVEVPFPAVATNASALVTVVATADDGTTDTATEWAYDDERRRLTIAIIDDDELVAFTPDVGETTLGAIALRDDEDQVDGCRRAAARLLTDRPAPGTEGVRGAAVPAELAAAVLPAEGSWTAARFAGLQESQRYGICLYSAGASRGGSQIEATDAVLVQAPDREQYRVRPLELIGPGSIDGDRVDVTLLGNRWALTATTAESAEQDLPDSSWHEFGELPSPEVATATVTWEGHTSEASISFPAHCLGPATCDPVGAARLVRLDIPGPDYTRRLCGTGSGSCDDGLRRRTEVLGSVILLIERLAGRSGFEGWTIGESRRFDAERPDPYWVVVDRARSAFRIAADGTVSAEIHTDVASTLRIGLAGCSPLAPVSSEMVEDLTPARVHTIVFPDRLGEGGCAWAGFTVSDPTGARTDESGELAGVQRAAIRADVGVQAAVLAWPEAVPEGMWGSVFVAVNGRPEGPPAVLGRDWFFDCVPLGTAVPAVPSPAPASSLGVDNTVVVTMQFVAGCADSGFPRVPRLVAELAVPWSDLADGSTDVEVERPDGLRVRFTVSVTNVVLP